MPTEHGILACLDLPTPALRPGAVLLGVEAVPLLSYMKAHVAGELPYFYPSRPFIPGTNGIATVLAAGPDVHHLAPGQRVAVSPSSPPRNRWPSPPAS